MAMNTVLKIILIFSILTLITSCEEHTMTKNMVVSDADYNIENIDISKIAQRKIYCGHQSVGFNILDGISDRMLRNPGVRLNIVRSKDVGVFSEPVFAHSTIGENSDPELKITDFKNTIDSGIGNNADIAFFKLCYLDINKTTKLEKVFSIYKNTMDQLKHEYPGTKFIHVTVPLTVSEFSIRDSIKKLLGRQDNNIMRNHFNDRLIAEYGGKDAIFNLAEIESTYPDGSRSSFIEDNNMYYSLAPEYASDNGHLNEIGRKIVATELLRLLSELK